MTTGGAPAVPVAVVYGGPSAEHDVSIVSGTAIAEALAGNGHAVSQFVVDLAGALVAHARRSPARGPPWRRV